MQDIGLKWRELFLSEEGATATEYAVMLGLIIIVCIAAIAAIGNKVNNSFEKMSNWTPGN